MDWLRQLLGIKTSLEIMLEHVQKAHERDLEVIRIQMGTIDRVVAARYDRPTYSSADPAPAPNINENDLPDVLTDGDDDAFFERSERLFQ